MDPTQTIILTSIVNIIITGLVGGIVIYRIQKKIDATIQKSLFEHQTKFTISHAKAVETLQTLYQKYKAFTEAADLLLLDKKYVQLEKSEWKQRAKNLGNLIADFLDYAKVNSLFLSPQFAETISTICFHSTWEYSTIYDILLSSERDETDTLRWAVDPPPFTSKNLEGQEQDLNAVVKGTTKSLEHMARILESLYRSVADIEQ